MTLISEPREQRSVPYRYSRDVTCHMGSHSFTWHPTHVNTPRLNPSQTGRYLIYLPRRDGRLSWHPLAPCFWCQFLMRLVRWT